MRLEAELDWPRLRESSEVGSVRSQAMQRRPQSQQTERRERYSVPTYQSEVMPAVQVTIGRVEVRAVKPTVPTPPRQTTTQRKPALSLSDYLKQREGGRL